MCTGCREEKRISYLQTQWTVVTVTGSSTAGCETSYLADY